MALFGKAYMKGQIIETIRERAIIVLTCAGTWARLGPQNKIQYVRLTKEVIIINNAGLYSRRADVSLEKNGSWGHTL